MTRPRRFRRTPSGDGSRRRPLRARLGATAVIVGLLVATATASGLSGCASSSGRDASAGSGHPGAAAGPAARASAPASAGVGTARGATAGGAAAGTAASGPPVTVAVRMPARASGRRVPSGFLGISLEYWGLAQDESHARTFARVLDLLHAPGSGPMTVRIGGNSSEVTFLRPRHGRLPGWAYGIGPAFIRRTARLVRADHLRVIADLNEATAAPRQARALALALRRGLPRGRLTGFELGNEPDGYAHSLWAPRLARTPGLALLMHAPATPGDDDAEYLAMARALRGVTPHLTLLGPALARPRLDVSWVRALLAGPHPALGAITVHEYPYSACAPPGTSGSPTIARLLSGHALRAMASAIAPAVALARRARLPLRVTEFNSVTCGGRPGVSDTFATALWAPGALFEMLSAGARSAFLHARSVPANSPFHWDAAGLDAQPLLYGLLLFSRALGPGARLEPVHLRATGPAAVSAWAVALRSGVRHLVVLDRGARSLRLVLHVGRGRRVAVGRLLAPSVAARVGETLEGQTLDGAARWSGRRIVTPVRASAGRAVVAVPAHSAALITIRRR